MTTKIDIDFEKLDCYIKELETLLTQLDEPSYKSLEFWLSDTSGSGMVLDYMYKFCNRTIEFHDGVYELITNTIAYLKEVRKLKSADQAIADNL